MSDPEGRSSTETAAGRRRAAAARRSGGGLFGRWLRADETAPASSAEALSDSEAAAEVDIVDQAEAFARLRVSEVMTPRADILALEVSLPLAEVARRFVESEHSRMPVYREGLDDPVGVVHLKDVVRLIAPGGEAGEAGPAWKEPVLHRLRREVLYVPGSMRAEDLLLKMRAARTHMALVIDEFGGTDGLVTLEDLVEAVVGEISDEHDEEAAAQIVERPGGVLEADARAALDDLEARLGHPLPPPDADEDVDTVGGLVAALAGRLPQRGEVIVHPDGVEFEVVEADPRRIRRLRIRPAHPNIAPQALTPAEDEPPATVIEAPSAETAAPPSERPADVEGCQDA